MQIIFLGDFGPEEANNKRLAKQLKTQLSEQYPNLRTEIWSTTDRSVTNPAINAAAPDLLVTFDLAGFTFITLTGGVVFRQTMNFSFWSGLLSSLSNKIYLRSSRCFISSFRP